MESLESEKSLKALTDLVKEQNLNQEEEILQIKLQKKENSEENEGMMSILNSIFRVLSDQLAFQKSAELQKEIAGELVPKDYQEQPNIESQSYSRESVSAESGGVGGLFGAYGIFALFKDGLKGLVTILKDVGSKLMEFLGIGNLLESFKTGLGEIIGKTGEFLRALSPAIMRFTALAGIIYTVLQGLEKFGEWFRSITGLPSIQNDAFNMRNYTGENPQYDRPMTPEEFEQNRIPKTVGGESARRDGGAPEQPMTPETFERQRIPKSMEGRWERAKADISEAAEKTGVDPGVLTKIAHFESKFNPEAMPITKSGKKLSSAHGYGQFLEGTWKSTVEKYGSKYGLDIKNPEKYRHDPKVQALMLAEFTKKNMELGEKLGGKDPDANVYAMHNLGEGGGSKFLKAMSQNPNAPVSSVLSEQVIRGNPSLYGSGNISLSEAYKNMSKAMRGGEAYAQDIKKGDSQYAGTNQSKTASKASNEGIQQPNMVDVSDLRVKGGIKGQAFKGGETEEGTLNLARSIQAQENDLPGGLNRFSSFNDAYHKKASSTSKHTKGLALDFSLKDSKYSSEASDYVKKQLIGSGLSEEDFKIINEYKNPSKHATGGHIHVNFANKEAAEKYAQYSKGGEQQPTYAKIDEKQVPEGGKYKEEESEMEETNEPILKEKVSTEKSALVDNNIDAKVDSGYKSFFEDMVDHLEKMVTFTQDIKETNKEMLKAETTAKKESFSTKSEEKETAAKEEYVPNDQASKESFLSADKESTLSNFGINSPQPISTTGTTFGGFEQNPFGTIQNVLGGIGSAVSIGQQMGNIGKYGGMGGGMMGGIYGAQGAIGGIQGVLGQMGQQSPMLGGLGQVLGSAGSVMGSIENIKNAGKYGGGILGGINAASGAIGTAGNIFNAVGGMFGSSSTPSSPGDISASTKKVGQALGSTPTISGIGDSIGNFFGGMFGSSSAPSSPGDISASTKKAGQALGSTPYVSDMGIGSDSAAMNAKYSMMEDSTNRGFSLENMTRSVETTKEENMTPPEPSAPVTIQQGGKGGGGGISGGSADNPPSGGVMGMDIGVRNEEPTLLRAQYGSVRIV